MLHALVVNFFDYKVQLIISWGLESKLLTENFSVKSPYIKLMFKAFKGLINRWVESVESVDSRYE